MRLTKELLDWITKHPTADRFAVHPFTSAAIEELATVLTVLSKEETDALLKEQGETRDTTDLLFQGGIRTLGGKPLRIDTQVGIDVFEIYNSGSLIAAVRLWEA